MAGLSKAWEAARSNIAKSQKKQKHQYDKKSRPMKYKIGDRVMVYMPHEMQGKSRKLALPHHGPYRIVDLTPSCVTVRPVDNPQAKSIVVNQDRISRCHEELPDVTWLGPRRRRSRRHQARKMNSLEDV